MTSLTPDQQLQKLINAAFHLRLSPQKFVKLFSQLQERVHLEANLAGDALFGSLSPDTKSIDSLFIQYLVALAFDFKSPLCIPKLLYYIRVAQRKALKNDPTSVVSYNVLRFCEPLIFVALSKSLHLWPQDPSSVTPETRRSLLILLIGYMTDCSNAESHSSHQHTRAITAFLLALARSKVMLQILPTKNTNHKELEAFNMAIFKFSNLLQTVDPVLARDLHSTYVSIFDIIKHPNAVAKTFDSFKPSRVFKLIWLESVLITNRATENTLFRSEAQFFLLHENPVKLIPSLITAAFDGLSVALLRNDSAQTITLWKGFIIKRLPLIVKDLLASSSINLNPTLIESMICNPITSLSNDTLTLLQRSAGNNSLVDEMFPSEEEAANSQYGLRYDFLRVLVLLSVLTEHSFHSIVNDPAFTPPVVSRIDLVALRDNGLVVNFTTNQSFFLGELVSSALNENSEYTPFESSTIVRLVNTFRDLEGVYQERLAREFLQLITSWIESGNTHNISRFCQALALSVPTMDVLLLHVSPKQLFGPLAKLVDDWQHDEDEINFQEIYTDFGCILLTLVLAHERFGLLPSVHLDCHQREGSFFQSLIGQKGINEGLDELSSQRRELLGGWISALFDAGGISDDLMRVSSVKDLYTLVPAIFRQAVVALSTKIIDFEVLRGGLEYFLQPFLLPSLLLAFRWIGDSLWRQADVMTMVQIVQFLLMSEISPEAQRIHQIVLSITASELFQMLTHVAATASTANNGTNGQGQLFVEPRLLSILEQFYAAAPRDPLLELQSSVADALSQHIVALTQWAVAPADAGPPGYHFGLISRAVAELGATRVLLTLLDCLDAAGGANVVEGAAVGTPQFEAMLEVVTALITQSVSENSTTHKVHLDGNLVHAVVKCTEEEMQQLRVVAVSVKQEDATTRVPTGATTGNVNNTASTGAAPVPPLYGFKRLQANVNAYIAESSQPQP